MRLPAFEYHAPDSLDKALKIKASFGTSATILAGGTDVVVNLKHRLLAPAVVLSLKNIKELRGIHVKPDAVVVHAGTSLHDTASHEAIQRHFPILKKAIDSIGALGIQHFRGTMGGNLCLTPRCIMYNQSYYWRTSKGTCHRTGGKDCLVLKGSESCQAICSADTVPVLTALSAQLTIAGASGTRILPVSDFFTGKGESPFRLTPDELVTEIRIPLPWSPFSWSYQRLSMRAAVDFPLINAAAMAIVEKGKVETFRLVVSAAGPAPIVLRDAETLIKGQAPSPEMLDQVKHIAMKAVEGVMVENATQSKEYRTKMAGVMAARATREALGL